MSLIVLRHVAQHRVLIEDMYTYSQSMMAMLLKLEQELVMHDDPAGFDNVRKIHHLQRQNGRDVPVEVDKCCWAPSVM